MKVGNWKERHVSKNRSASSFKTGILEASWSGIRLLTEDKRMDIELSDDELDNLIYQLNLIKNAKQKAECKIKKKF